MAGRPKLRAAVKAIEAKGGAELITEHLHAGGTITGLADKLGVTRGTLYTAIRANDDFRKAYEAAKEGAAEAHAEQGFIIWNELKKERREERKNADPDSRAAELNAVDIAIAKESGNWHRFMAESWNQKTYGKRGDVNLNISVGDMHLDALRKMKVVEDVDAKLIEND